MKNKFFKKLLALYYIFRDRSKYKHYLVYTITCNVYYIDKETGDVGSIVIIKDNVTNTKLEDFK